MNLQFLGDVFDHWKGSLIEELSRARLLRDLSVDPMATDESDWLPSDFVIYARLLGIAPQDVLRHEAGIAVNRASYMAEITHEGDLFLDPDTGITSGKRKPRYPLKYLYPAELHHFISVPQRVVAVFQHAGRQRTHQRLEILMHKIKSTGSEFACCSYESVHAAILFFSQDSRRIIHIRNHLTALLGDHAPKRVGFWHEIL
jgi:hypothetical protein